MNSGRPSSCRYDGEHPLFEQAGGGAVRFEMRRVDHDGVSRLAPAGQGGEDPVEDADPAPADEAVVERLRRSVDAWRVPPHQPAPDDMNNPRNHPPVINPRHTARLVRQKRFQTRELLYGKPEVVIGHPKR